MFTIFPPMAEFLLSMYNTKTYNPSIRADERLTLETSASFSMSSLVARVKFESRVRFDLGFNFFSFLGFFLSVLVLMAVTVISVLIMSDANTR